MKKKNKKNTNNIGYHFVSPILRIFMFLFMKPTIIHKENIPEGGFLYAGTHVSYFDGLEVGYTTTRCVHFIAKKELFKNILLNNFFKFLGVIPVDRNNKNPEAKKEAIDNLKNNNIVCIFPEGTINKTNNYILPFKYGAVSIAHKANKPIVPFAIIGKPKIFNYRVKIIIGKPIYIKTDDYPNETKKLENEVINLIKEIENERKA